MKARVSLCAALALAGAAGQAFGQGGYVRPVPIHQVPDSQDNLAPDPPAPPTPMEMAQIDQAQGQGDRAAPVQSAQPGPQVAVARRIVDAAGAFDGYMKRAADITSKFSGGDAVARAVALGSVYEPGQMDQGAIAYAALVALQDPMFVQVVQELGQNPNASAAFAASLVDHPEAVLDAAAARRTATRVSNVLAKMGLRLVAAGAAVRQAAYDIQTQDWSKGPIATPDQRLARIKSQSSIPISLLPADQAHLIRGLADLRTDDGAPPQEAEAATAVVTRGLAVAALAILGRAGDDQAQQIAPLLTDAKDAQCLKMAKLDLFECLAVAGPHYEDVFCLGRHAMMETGQCIASAAGVSTDQMRPLTDRQSVFVPIALAADQGSERRDAFVTQRSAGVAIPVAGPAQPANYSPYSGPSEP